MPLLWQGHLCLRGQQPALLPPRVLGRSPGPNTDGETEARVEGGVPVHGHPSAGRTWCPSAPRGLPGPALSDVVSSPVKPAVTDVVRVLWTSDARRVSFMIVDASCRRESPRTTLLTIRCRRHLGRR